MFDGAGKIVKLATDRKSLEDPSVPTTTRSAEVYRAGFLALPPLPVGYMHTRPASRLQACE